MSKILTTLIAGLFAASAFAADVPKAAPTTTDAKPAAEAPAAHKTVKKEHKTTHHKTAKKSHTSGDMSTAPNASPAPVSK